MRWTLKVSMWASIEDGFNGSVRRNGCGRLGGLSTRGDLGRGETRMQIHFRSRIVAFYVLHKYANFRQQKG